MSNDFKPIYIVANAVDAITSLDNNHIQRLVPARQRGIVLLYLLNRWHQKYRMKKCNNAAIFRESAHALSYRSLPLLHPASADVFGNTFTSIFSHVPTQKLWRSYSGLAKQSFQISLFLLHRPCIPFHCLSCKSFVSQTQKLTQPS